MRNDYKSSQRFMTELDSPETHIYISTRGYRGCLNSACEIENLEVYYSRYTISVNDHSSYFAASPLQFHLPVPLHALTSRLIASLSWGELHDAPRSDLHNGTCSLHHRCPLSLCYIFLQRFCFLLLYMQRKKRVQNCTCHLSSPTVCLWA